MADENKSTAPAKKESAPAASSSPEKTGGQNGKGDAPRNCFSDTYRNNFDGIDWSK